MDNGAQFTHRFTTQGKQASGVYVFDRACASAYIRHRAFVLRSWHKV
jgi:hypothetical protein